MYIPANYLVTRNSRTGIFLLNEKPARKGRDKSLTARFYPIDNALTGRAAIVDLPLHTRVIISGRNALTDGQAVYIQAVQSKTATQVKEPL